MFKRPGLRKAEVEVKEHSGYHSDNAYLENAQNIALANLKTQHEALEKSLVIMWKTMLLAMVSVLLSVVAIGIAVLK